MASSGHLELCVFLVLCVIGVIRAQAQLEYVENEKVCSGTSEGLVARGDWHFRYNRYKNLYTNCTYLFGNLEIIFLDETGKNYDLSFLSNIRQVTGYVLIVGVHADYVPLTSLQIIRGKTLFHYSKSKDDYSLFVALNYDKNDRRIGLKELRFTSLKEILRGKIFFMNNNLLCFENTINWQDINPYQKPPVEFKFNSTDYRRPCDNTVECHPSCLSDVTGQRHCWGAGPGMCQNLTQGEACHPSCERRCFGKLPNQCCHQECAGGCSGPLKTDCMTCRNFYNEGSCVPYCPPATIYDNRQMMNVPNPDAKFAYGGICVKECPGYLLKDAGSCVRACPEGKHENKEKRICEMCEGPCPRKCNGTGTKHLTSENLGSFVNCTTIDGHLKIVMASFNGDPHYNIEPLHPNDLVALKHVKEITGFLLIQSDHEDFTNLSFLSSLEIITGRQLDGTQSMNILATPLQSLELTSLKRIANGNVFIVGNTDLCYVQTINWNELFDNPNQVANINHNKPASKCAAIGEVCDPQCNGDGCWGKGANKCLSCLKFEFEEEHLCLSNCTDRDLLYDSGDGKCKHCHSQCNQTCSGPSNTECDECANVGIKGTDGQVRCMSECPMSMYPDSDKLCQPCHIFCETFGCTGPSHEVREGGCNSCEKGFKLTKGDGLITCLPPDTDSCKKGYHMTSVSTSSTSPMAGQKICEPCHRFCDTCSGPGFRYCETCKFFRGSDGYCTDSCQQYEFGDKASKQCYECHPECRGGCGGSSSVNCHACSNFKIFLDEERKTFNCTKMCPPSLPYEVRDDTTEDERESRNVCADETHEEVQAMFKRDREEEKKKILIIVVPSICGVLLLGGLLALFGYYCQKRAKAKEKTAELTARMTGFDETEPVTPTNAQPDLAKLRLVKESELRKGGIIGSGAFGTVYKGFWIPEGENVKIPVAIKVLQDGTSPNQNKELLEEARVMASVEHACCIRILAVCMSAQMMLITQLMPLGCLLDYVRKNKEHIGSKVLLNWCTQIAKGMSYLEERGIVHRDLAARNVLVQTPTQVKITDFGLAKLLDYNEEEYHAAGGKMPIKWLALECIQHRIFTHKSDVWSFGVTAWELFTYGQKPYDNIRARDVPGLLEKGERLPQPSICTIDVYMIMIKCWMLDAESRPSFKELAEEFAKMARDPGRYLVVQGDKLLRLPSHSYDKSELVRSVSVAADGPEEIMEADDYLQPQEPPHSPMVIFENNNSPSTPLLSQGACVKPEKGEMSGLPWRERNYAHLDAAVEARKQRQQSPTRGREDSFNSRYSSDPIKFFKDKEEIEGIASYPYQGSYPFPNTPPAQYNGRIAIPNGKMSKMNPLHLPVDEDNYLAPQSTASYPAMYTDLSDKGYYQNEKVFEEEAEGKETDSMLGSSTQRVMQAVANPEYFDQEEDDVWETKPYQNGIHHNGPTLHKGHPRENGHNYYNDFSSPHPLQSPMGATGGGVGRGGGRVLVRDQLPSESQV